MGILSQILKRRSAVLHILPPDATVDQAVSTMAANKVGIVQIQQGGKLLGVFSERDLLRRVVAKGLRIESTKLHEVMTSDPVTGHASDHQSTAILKMQERNCRHLPIVESGTVVDMLSMRDLLREEISEKDREVTELKDYIKGGPTPKT